MNNPSQYASTGSGTVALSGVAATAFAPAARASLLKPELQAIATLVALQGERDAGRLDAVGLELVQQAEEVLAARSGRIVMTAWLRWNAGGRPARDPRGAPVRVLDADISQRPDHGGRRGGPSSREGAGR